MSGSTTVIVDSSSPSIRYVGDWIPSDPTDDMRDPTKFMGGTLPFSKQLYRAPEGKQVSLFHTFTGTTKLHVRGTVDTADRGAVSYDQMCDVQPRGPMVATESFLISGGQENDYMLCELRNLTPTETYTLNFTVNVERGHPVWFDRLVLEPSANADLTNALVRLDHRHLSIKYDNDWVNNFNSVHYTNKSQSKVAFDFTGTSVSWYHSHVINWARGSSQATWSIDNEPQQTVTIPAVEPALASLFVEELLFKTPELEPRPHRLEVTYLGQDPTVERPLSLRNLLVQNAPIPTGAPTSSTPVSGSQTPAGGHVSTSELSQGAKIGVGVGVSVAGMILIGVFVLMFLRKRRMAAKKDHLPTKLARENSGSLSSESDQREFDIIIAPHRSVASLKRNLLRKNVGEMFEMLVTSQRSRPKSDVTSSNTRNYPAEDVHRSTPGIRRVYWEKDRLHAHVCFTSVVIYLYCTKGEILHDNRSDIVSLNQICPYAGARIETGGGNPQQPASVTGLRLHATVNTTRSGTGTPPLNQVCEVTPHGTALASDPVLPASALVNDHILCDIRSLLPTQTYTFNYTVNVASGGVWFDRLVLDPTSDLNIGDFTIVELDHRHPSIRYDRDWTNIDDVLHRTNKPQSKMWVNFTGMNSTIQGLIPD
ncbi:hypothetical protein CVT24_006565 [Panaeolus cyanescens]|uniref:Uncharacterized protein n=1 Tax=Panaeolus cyanescens TaxID=181874 RepID=A0A409WBZ9_9AGAR|nr:hypothetical protein CVT24_006565 [Panaeolus cyanescens]